jgi:hypothetical protein
LVDFGREEREHQCRDAVGVVDERPVPAAIEQVDIAAREASPLGGTGIADLKPCRLDRDGARNCRGSRDAKAAWGRHRGIRD